jgi:hypothetical protein
MMLAEATRLFDQIPADEPTSAYQNAVVLENALGKPTRSTRSRTFQRLKELYILDPRRALFRNLRSFWSKTELGRPMLAFLLASARDSLLENLTDQILEIDPDTVVESNEVVEWLKDRYPSRYSNNTLRSTSLNLLSSWNQAGFLLGKRRKRRTKPFVDPATAAYALLIGYLRGLRGSSLFESSSVRFLDRRRYEIRELAAQASKLGLLDLKEAGTVVAIAFPDSLTHAEEIASREQN